MKKMWVMTRRKRRAPTCLLSGAVPGCAPIGLPAGSAFDTEDRQLTMRRFACMKKETVSRFSVSLPPSLLRQLDEMSGEKGYEATTTGRWPSLT